MLFGPYVAAVLTSLDGFVSNFRGKTRYTYKKFFNVALLCWSGLAAGHFFYYTAGSATPIPTPMEARDLPLFFGAVSATSLLFFLLNSGGVLLAMGLATRQPLSVAGKELFFWSSLSTVAGASIAAFIFLVFDKAELLGVAVAVPIVLAIYFAYKVSLNRINEALVHADQMEDAYTDALTGLPNLRYFRAFGERELQRAQRDNYPVTLLVMDLNSFKSVNDRFGHQIGDRVLIEIAHLLRTQLRSSDTCIRYGGDEFVGLLPGADTELANSTMQRLRETVEHHEILLKEGEIVNIGLSVGGAIFPRDAKDFDLLLTLADQAMYTDKLRHSKSASRGAVLPFEARGNP